MKNVKDTSDNEKIKRKDLSSKKVEPNNKSLPNREKTSNEEKSEGPNNKDESRKKKDSFIDTINNKLFKENKDAKNLKNEEKLNNNKNLDKKETEKQNEKHANDVDAKSKKVDSKSKSKLNESESEARVKKTNSFFRGLGKIKKSIKSIFKKDKKILPLNSEEKIKNKETSEQNSVKENDKQIKLGFISRFFNKKEELKNIDKEQNKENRPYLEKIFSSIETAICGTATVAAINKAKNYFDLSPMIDLWKEYLLKLGRELASSKTNKNKRLSKRIKSGIAKFIARKIIDGELKDMEEDKEVAQKEKESKDSSGQKLLNKSKSKKGSAHVDDSSDPTFSSNLVKTVGILTGKVVTSILGVAIKYTVGAGEAAIRGIV